MEHSVEEAVRNYLFYLSARGYANNTISAYRSDLQRFVSFLSDMGITDTADVLQEALDLYLFQLRLSVTNGECCSTTVGRRKMSLRGFLRFCKKRGWVSETLVPEEIAVTRQERRTIRPRHPLTPQEASLLLRATLEGDGPLRERNHLLIQLLLYTGMRRGEVASLRVFDVCLQEKVFILRNTKGGKFRVMPIANDLLATIVRYLSFRKLKGPEYLLQSRTGSRLGERQIAEIVKQSCLRAGIRVVSPHVLRHTFATMALSSGVNLVTVKELLGHSSILTTAEYLHAARPEMERAVNGVAVLLSQETGPVSGGSTLNINYWYKWR